jgi:site-specific DNA-methyltransferase (adenine-specific)
MTTAEENLNFQIWCEEWAKECLRVLKPGGYILSFCAARMYHRMTVGLEDAGFEIRDQIMWIYSSGFPKSQDVGKSIDRTNKKKNTAIDSSNWQGWGTALKPAHEPIALARKPLHKSNSIARNCQQWGTGALNIDATRVPYEDQKDIDTYLNNKRGPMERGNDEDGENIRMFNGETGFKAVKREVTVEEDLPELGRFPSNVIGEILQADYQKYFYCPKVSRKERHIGFDEIPYNGNSEVGGMYGENQAITRNNVEDKGNNHPTVKPIELMKYLIKLVTPPGGTVLDPFNGSGSTGCAAVELGFDYIGCELDPAYVKIAETRIRAWQNKDCATNNYGDLFE